MNRKQKELATDNNVATKSGKDNNAKDADYNWLSRKPLTLVTQSVRKRK